MSSCIASHFQGETGSANASWNLMAIVVIRSVGDGVGRPVLPLVDQHAFSLLLRVGVAERSSG
jgi:hypothetical protein